MIRLRLYRARERQRIIDPADLEAAYHAADPRTRPVFAHDGVRDVFGEDASPIRDALRCKLAEAPQDWA